MQTNVAIETKRQIWSYLSIRDLGRLASVSRVTHEDLRDARLWFDRSLALIRAKTIVEAGGQMEIGRRRGQRGQEDLPPHSIKPLPSLGSIRTTDSDFWCQWYRDLSKAITAYRKDKAQFDDCKQKCEQWRRKKARLREDVEQVNRGQRHQKQARSSLMNCVTSMNRSQRRQVAATASINAADSISSMAELQRELGNATEMVMNLENEKYMLNRRYRRALKKANRKLADGVRMLCDMSLDEVQSNE